MSSFLRLICIGVVLGSTLWGASVLAAPLDADDDTLSDVEEGPPGTDSNGNGKPDAQDLDSDGDGLPDALEAGDADVATPAVDTDKDGVPDFRDWDSDNDELPDALEDPNGNGIVDPGETDPRNADTDGDGVPDGVEDANHNGKIDPGEGSSANKDSDGDGIQDAQDLCDALAEDFDGLLDADGCPEDDADEDGVPDAVEMGHQCLDPLEPDADGDGLLDGQEDKNGNGIVDAGEADPCNKDTDGDAIPDDADQCPAQAEDFEGFQDVDGCPEGGPGPTLDSDGDGLLDVLELKGCTDWRKADSDGDGRADGAEDANHNGVRDAGETDPCAADFTPQGGGGCAARPAQGPGFAPWMGLAALGLLLARRRRSGRKG